MNSQPNVPHPSAADNDRPTQPQAPDRFDPASLRLTQDFAATAGVRKLLLNIPVRKPDKSWFFRVHPSPDYALETAVLELKEDREIYLVAPHLRHELAAESTLGLRMLFVGINRQNVLFVWPVTLPGPDGKTMAWHESAMEAALLARERWVRVQANMSLGANEVSVAVAEFSDPTWPEMPLADILRTAFKGKLIDSLDHPVLQRLRGER